MRILHVIDHLKNQNYEYALQCHHVIQGQNEAGIDASSLNAYESNGDFIGYLPLLKQQRMRRRLQKNIEDIINSDNIDIIHVHSPVSNLIAALRAGKRCNIPVHYDMHFLDHEKAVSKGVVKNGGLKHHVIRNHEMGVLRKATSISVKNRALAKELNIRGVDADKVVYIPTSFYDGGNDINAQRIDDLRGRLNVKDMTVLGFFGSFYDYEGADILLRSMRSIFPRLPNACALIIGSGAEESALHNVAARSLLGDRAVFPGAVPFNKIDEYQQLVDICIFPARKTIFTDTMLPLMPIQAMANEKIVFASDTDGHKEIIEDGKTGYIFKADKPISLAQKIGEYMDSKEQWQEMKNAAKEHVENNYNMNNTICAHKTLYEDMIRNG